MRTRVDSSHLRCQIRDAAAIGREDGHVLFEGIPVNSPWLSSRRGYLVEIITLAAEYVPDSNNFRTVLCPEGIPDPANRVGGSRERKPVTGGSIILRAADGAKQHHEMKQGRREPPDNVHGVAPSVIDSGLIESAISHYSGAIVSFRHPVAQEGFRSKRGRSYTFVADRGRRHPVESSLEARECRPVR